MKISSLLAPHLPASALDEVRSDAEASSSASHLDTTAAPIDDGVLRMQDTLRTAREASVTEVGARPTDGLRPELLGDGRAQNDPLTLGRSYITPRLTFGYREGDGWFVGHAGGNLDNGQEAGVRWFPSDHQVEVYVSMEGRDALRFDLREGNRPEPAETFAPPPGPQPESAEGLDAPPPGRGDEDDGDDWTTEDSSSSSSSTASDDTDDTSSTSSTESTDDGSETEESSEADDSAEADEASASESESADAEAEANADAEEGTEHHRGDRSERYSPFGDAVPAEIRALAEPGGRRGEVPMPTPGEGCGNGDDDLVLPDIGPDPDSGPETPTVESHLQQMVRPPDDDDPLACFEQESLHDGPRNPFDRAPVVNPGPI